MFQTVAKITYVEASIAPFILAEAMWLALLVLALIAISIAK